MALQVWLPLNGDLHNQGLAKVTITNNGATIDNNGKIGKCYYFNGSSYIRITIPSIMTTILNTTICAWVKSTSSVLALGGISQDLSNYSAPCVTLYTSGWQFTSTARSGYGYVSGGTVANTNTWHHVACTVDNNGNIKTYLDGVNVASNTLTALNVNANTTITSSNFIEIGCDHPGGDEFLTGYVNDFRVYNNALSVKEIEKIAQGLILHYPLIYSNPNLLSNFVTPGQAAPGATATAGRTNYYGNYGIIIPASENADTYFRLFLKEQLVQNNTYTISCYVSGLLSGTYYNFPLFAQGNTAMGLLQLNHNGLCSLTFTMNSSTQTAVTAPDGTTLYICFMDDSGRSIASGQGPITITGFKLEKGSIATNSISNNIIYDISGYNHNGEIINTLTVDSSSPKYNSCIHISATNQKIKISNLNTSGFGNSYSFAWWEKISSVTPMHWGFADGVRLNGMYYGHLWNTGDSSNNPLYNPGTTTQVTDPTVNVWHHWVMTGNGAKCYVYQDGILWGEAKTYKSISGTIIYINGWDTSTQYCSDNASMSDFRIYATALTAQQVKELYNTSKIVNGTIISPRNLE